MFSSGGIVITNRQLAWKKLVVAIRYAEDVSESTRAKGLESQTMRRLDEAAREYLAVVQHDLETKYDGDPNYCSWEDEQFLRELIARIEGFLEGTRPIQQFGVDMGYYMDAPDIGYFAELPYDRLV
jgi:hypothetical protein